MHAESSEQKCAVVHAVIEVAGEVGRTPAQVAPAWVNEKSRRLAAPSVPIIDPRSLDQLDDYLAALDLHHSARQFERLATVSAIELGVPHEATQES